mgnify:CR=1 FL=1
MRKLLPVLLLCAILCGCTDPTQPSAKQGLRRASDQYRSITNDFAAIAYQNALDAAAAKMDKDPASWREVLENLSTTDQTIGNLKTEAARADALLLFPKIYIDSQQGVGSILVNEMREADNRAKEEEEVTTQGS